MVNFGNFDQWAMAVQECLWPYKSSPCNYYWFFRSNCWISIPVSYAAIMKTNVPPSMKYRPINDNGSDSYLMVLPVRDRIHCGIGWFWRSFFTSFSLIFNDFLDPCKKYNLVILLPRWKGIKETWWQKMYGKTTTNFQQLCCSRALVVVCQSTHPTGIL